jgi:lipopolysaccharide export system protein LptA
MSQESNGLQTIDVMGHGIFSSKSGSGEQELRASFIHMTMNPSAGLLERVQSNGGIDFLMKRGDGETLITGEILDAIFTAGSSQLQSINVQQNAHMQTVVRGGGREELSSNEIRLSFRNEGGRTSLDRLQADLRVLWNSLPAPRSDQRSDSLGRSLSAHSLTVQYAEGCLQSAEASGSVIISGIPASSGNQSAIRRLETDAIRFQFYPGDNHLERFDGDGHVQVLYRMPSDPSKELPAREMRTSSSKIQGTFKDSDGSALSVSQWGGFKLQDGARTAVSDRCDYDAVKDVMILSGSPRLSDSNGVTTGEVMSFDRKQELLTVNRSVRTVVEPGGYSQATPFTDSTGSATPSLITADEMQYWTESSRVRFNGNVQLLSENGQLQAGMMQITGGGDELEAKGEVRHIIPGRASRAEAGPSTASGKIPSKKTSAPATGSSILVTCTQLRYSEKDRSIHYEGDVHLMAGSVSISANRLDAVLDEGRKQIESASAAGKVEVRQDARVVRGDRADYYLQPGKFVVSGNLAEIAEPRRGKSWARRLTFFTSDDRILLENP